MFGLTILTWLATAAGTCLPNGVIPELRKNLTNAQGESFPVGVILQPYASARLAHEVLAVLITEVLGYNLRSDPNVPPSSVDMLYAMVGCKTWFNKDDRGCEVRKIELHLAVESWHLSYPNSVESVRQTYQAEMPLSADMGYMGDTGQYISANAVEARVSPWFHDVSWFHQRLSWACCSSTTMCSIVFSKHNVYPKSFVCNARCC